MISLPTMYCNYNISGSCYREVNPPPTPTFHSPHLKYAGVGVCSCPNMGDKRCPIQPLKNV